MKFIVPLGNDNMVTLLRRGGYAFQRHADDGEASFIRPLAAAGYPRFHIYARPEGFGGVAISIHLDVKRETYGQDTRHHGEYNDDGALGQEVARLKGLWGDMAQ